MEKNSKGSQHEASKNMLDMKRSPSEWDLEAFLRHDYENDNRRSSTTFEDDLLFLKTTASTITTANGSVPSYGLVANRDPIESHMGGGLGGGWHGSLIPKQHSGISATIESQSSICAGSPISANKPLSKGDVQALEGLSDSDQSDDESMELEGGSVEQDTDVIDLKRMRRMVSNRESARRSRKRKQAQLADLESQVDKLRGENALLYKQLTEASQQFSDAATDNRELKFNVETMRIKVKHAEELVARGSGTLNRALQSHNLPPQLSRTRSTCRVPDILTTTETQALNMPITGQFHGLAIGPDDINIHDIAARMNQNMQRIASLEQLQNKIW